MLGDLLPSVGSFSPEPAPPPAPAAASAPEPAAPELDEVQSFNMSDEVRC